MNIVSIDLPWNPDKKGRRALAVADLDGNIRIMSANDDGELLQLVRDNTEPSSLVLLDVPIDGCENLGGEHFRPVDTAISKQALPALPASKARGRGKRLKELLEKDNRVKVQEIYPYAIYKFLAYLKDEKLLPSLKVNKFDVLLNDRFRAYWPRKYKRERDKFQRLGNMQYLYSLLMDTGIGLGFRIPLNYPDASSNLGQLSDEYDACLGAIVGIHFANNSSYACIAGDSNSGNILLLADRWLSERLSREVQVHQPDKRS